MFYDALSIYSISLLEVPSIFLSWIESFGNSNLIHWGEGPWVLATPVKAIRVGLGFKKLLAHSYCLFLSLKSREWAFTAPNRWSKIEEARERERERERNGFNFSSDFFWARKCNLSFHLFHLRQLHFEILIFSLTQFALYLYGACSIKLFSS